MEPGRKRRLNDLLPKALIKQEVEWRAEDSNPTDLANQAVKLDMNHLLSIKTEKDASYCDADRYEAHQFTPDPKTPAGDYEGTKAELTSDEKFMDENNHSNPGCSNQTNKRRLLTLADHQKTRIGTANNESQTCLRSSDSKPEEHCERPYKCELCPRSFRHKWYMKVHLNTHVKQRARKFPCPSCTKAFYTQQCLKIHMKTCIHKTKCEVYGIFYKEEESQDIDVLPLHTDGFTSPSDSQNEVYELNSDSHPENLEMHWSETQPFTEDFREAEDSTNLKEEFISDEEFIDEENGSDARKH